MKKALAYLRKSTDTKDQQVLSLDTQKREIAIARKRAEDFFGEPVEIIWEYTEKVSGGSDTRPEFMKMTERFRRWEADILLSWRLDRLSRNHADSLMILQAIDEGIIPMIQDSNRIWTKNDTGISMYVAFGMAIEELKTTKKRSSEGMKTFIEKWWVPFLVPFGARNVREKSVPIEKRVVIDPLESRFARKMFEKRVEGESFEKIAKWLYVNGYKSSTGGVINSSTIEGWVKNKFYYWVVEWGWQTWQHIYEPIISKDLWTRANAVWRGSTPRKQKDMFPLKWVVKSWNSWCILTASVAKKIYPQYHSHSRWKNEKVSISEASILEYFETQLEFYHLPKVVKPYVMRALKKVYQKQLDELEKERTFLSSEITKYTNKLDWLIDLRVNQELTAEQFGEKQKEYVEKSVDLKARLEKVIKKDNAIMTSLSESVELLTNLNQFWKTADDTQKCRIIKMIVVELLIDDQKRVYIRENAVFEGLRFLNHSQWSSIHSNGRTREWEDSPLMRLARQLMDNPEISINICSTLSSMTE